MHPKKLELAEEIALWLRKLRLQNRMTIAETAKKTQIEENLIEGWEAGFPIPLSDFMVLMKVYGVGSMLAGARISAWQAKYLESSGRGRA